jgi:predicted transcriptional regulator
MIVENIEIDDELHQRVQELANVHTGGDVAAMKGARHELASKACAGIQ